MGQMLELTRKGQDVYHKGIKLTRVDQATKGPGNEVIKIEGLPESNGQKWVSLRQLKEGINQIQTKGRQVVSTTTYILNPTEKAEVDKLQARINQIKDAARLRYQAQPKFKPVDKMNPTELEAYIKYLKELQVKGE